MRLVIELEKYVGVTFIDARDLRPERHTIAVGHRPTCATPLGLPTGIGPLQVDDDIQLHRSQRIHYLLDEPLVLPSRTKLAGISAQPATHANRAPTAIRT